MSNGYKHHHHHHSHNQNFTYLPLLCRASAQDIKVTVPRFSGDPSSPRVTCIGHVKRSNKVIGFPTPKFSTTTTTAATTTPIARRSIHNSTYNSTHHQQQPRFNKSKSAPRTPLKTITAATVATSPGVCGLPRGSILISNHSPLRHKTKHQKSSNPSPRTPKATVNATTPPIHAPARAIILNVRPVPKTTFEKSSAGSWMNLNTSVKSNINYSKLKRLLFHEKTNESITRNYSRSREIKIADNTRKAEINGESHRNYDVELDPPLPVVKKVKEPGFDREEVNLWKRRSTKTGIELKSLKIQQLHIGNNKHHQIPTTV